MSLTSPPIRQYRPEYYKVHYSADVPEAEVLQPQQLFSTSFFFAIAKGTPPTDFRIRHSLLRDWEGLQRASLGVINHLDWFFSTVWKMVGAVEVEPQMRANIDNILTSSSVAVNHLAHVQARMLAGNAAFRREGLLDASVLDRAGAQFLRSQPIGAADVFAGKVPEALRVASEDRNKQLLFQAAVKPAGGAAGLPRGPPRAQRGGFKKRKGFTPSTSQVTHKRPKPQGQTTMYRHVEKGKGAKLGVTATWTNSSSTSVGARLRNFPREWDNLTTDRYVRSIVRDGYRVEPSTPIPRPHSHEIVSRHRAVKRSASGNNVLAGQGSDRGIRSKIALPRILQSAVLGSQDRRVISSGIRLKILEPVCPQGKVQDDHSQNSDKCDAQGGLGSQYRSERRILSRPYSRPVQTSATIRHSNERRAPCFRIQSSIVRSDLCPQGVYQGNSSVGAPCASARRLPSSVSRRLATEKSKQVTVGSANKLVARYHSSGEVCTKCGQVTTNTHATSDTHRGGISSRPRSDVPSDDMSSKVRGQDIDTYVSADHDSLLFPVAPRTSELCNRCNPTRQVASQTYAAVFAKSQGTGLKGPQGPDPSEARPVGPSPSVVVEQEVHQSRNATGHSRGSDAPLYRRVRVGLGSPFGQTPSEWELVDDGGHSAHQSIT